jgi:hypothetical protein
MKVEFPSMLRTLKVYHSYVPDVSFIRKLFLSALNYSLSLLYYCGKSSDLA